MIVGFNLHKIEFNVGDVVIARSDILLPYCTICANHEFLVIVKNDIKDKYDSKKRTYDYTLKDSESDVCFSNMKSEFFSLKTDLKKAQYIYNANEDKIKLLKFIEVYCPKRRHVTSEINSTVSWVYCDKWERCKPKESCIFCVPKDNFKRGDENFIYMYIRLLKVRKIKKQIKDGL